MASSSSPSVTHDYGPDSGGRLKGVKVVKPVIVGNVAKYFGKKRETDGHTHSWTVFLRPYLSEDYSVFIKKVQFKLHESYPNPNRIVTKPPYEITETGWGEFEIAVKIHFVDPVERPVTVYHVLKLFEVNKDPSGPPVIVKSISSETYDEMVFLEPTRLMMSLIDSLKPVKANWKPETDFEGKKKGSLQSIASARSVVKNEIEDLKNRLKLSRETIEIFKKKLLEAQEAANQEEPSTPSSSGSVQGPSTSQGAAMAASTSGTSAAAGSATASSSTTTATATATSSVIPSQMEADTPSSAV